MDAHDVISLIAVGTVRDSDGYRIPAEESRRTIFAERRSPDRREFYQAMQAGVETSDVFVVYRAEYNGEKTLEHSGKRYRIVRSYAKSGSDFLELYVTDAGEDSNG